MPLPVQEDQPTGGAPARRAGRGRGRGRRGKAVEGTVGPQVRQACPEPSPAARAGRSAPPRAASYLDGEQLGHIPRPQQRARASGSARQGQGRALPEAATEASVCSSGQASAGSVGPGGLLWGGSPRAGVTGATEQPACCAGFRSQQSQSGRLGCGGGRSGQDPNEELTCSPSSPAAFPLPTPGQPRGERG